MVVFTFVPFYKRQKSLVYFPVSAVEACSDISGQVSMQQVVQTVTCLGERDKETV